MKTGDDRQRTMPPTEDPADVLGDVWEALDVLPRSTMPASMAATTIEMAAVSARTRTVAVPRSPGAWLLAAVAVAGCFAMGFVAGRTSLPPAALRPPARGAPRAAIREIIEEEMAKQRRPPAERIRDQRRPPRSPAEIPAPPR